MPAPTLTAPPPAPNRLSPDTFSARADDFLAWMVTAQTEYIGFAAYLQNLALATGPGLFGDGSASAPSVSFASDTNTGMFRSSDDVIAFAVGGVLAARLNAPGTTMPSGFTIVTKEKGDAAYQPLDADLTALAGLSGVQGDIMYRDATQWQRLPKGTAGQHLQQNAAATAPEWVSPVGSIVAWVNFNGSGTVAIRASGNVSSITDNGTGDYTINFTNALPDANYVVSGTCQRNDAAFRDAIVSPKNGTNTADQTTTSVRIVTYDATGGAIDVISAQIFIVR